jgi:hypothetical protein
MHIYKKTTLLSQKGQILVAVLFIMALALGIGVSMSNRFVGSIRNYTQIDNLDKATSIAEAGIEKILLIPADTLKTYATNNSCGTTCQVQITDTNGQLISAEVKLSLTGNSSTDAYPLSLTTTQSTEVTLSGYQSGKSVYVCWNTEASIEVIYIYTQSSVYKATAYAANAVTTSHSENNFSASTSRFGYANCMTITASQTPQALRLKSYYEDTDVYVLPESGYTLPIQGILITSTGKAGTAQKTMSVLKTNSYTPTVFDYVLYQKSETDPLSN